MADIRFINPETLSKPPSYTHVVEVTGPGRTIYISGQLGTDRSGNIVGGGGDFHAQAVQVFDNLHAALAAVGASFKDVVKLNSYLANIAHLALLRDVRSRYLNADALPASTTIAVTAFARPAALIEVEAVAVVPAKATAKATAVKAPAGAKAKAAQRKER